jgi:hypothetical protein
MFCDSLNVITNVSLTAEGGEKGVCYRTAGDLPRNHETDPPPPQLMTTGADSPEHGAPMMTLSV